MAEQKRVKTSKGAHGPLWDGREKTVNWKNAGAEWGSSFNRKTKMPVVKTRAVKRGID